MRTTDFVELLRQTVVNPAVSGNISQIEKPSDRNPPEDRRRRAAWFAALSAEEREYVESTTAEAARAALFGTLSVLDGHG